MHLVFTYFFSALALYASSILALSFLAAKIPAAGFYARILSSFACLVFCAWYGVVASVVLRCIGYGGLSQWTVARCFQWTMRWATGVQFAVQGEEHLVTRPAVFIGNHQTELDVLMLGAIFPPYCSVTAKKSLKYVPILGWFMALSKTVFIDRGNRQTAKLAFDGAARVMREERQSVYIFPEGTRSYTTQPDLLPFKKGAFHLAVQAQVPIVPVVVANYSNVLHLQSRTFTSGKIPVKVLPPISTLNLTAADVDQLVEKAHKMMLEELVKLTNYARGQGVAPTNTSAETRLLDETDSGRSSGSDARVDHVRPEY